MEGVLSINPQHDIYTLTEAFLATFPGLCADPTSPGCREYNRALLYVKMMHIPEA